MSRLITASLVGSIDWLTMCPSSWRTKAYADLTNQLARIYTKEMSKPAKRGLELEAAIYSHVFRPNNKAGSEHFKWLVNECKGGAFQKIVKTFIRLDNFEYCLYGKLDVWFPDIIKDIKTTGRYRGKEKYLSSFQHKLYCCIERIHKFKYIIGEFDGDDGKTLIAHYDVEYEVEYWNALYIEVMDKVKSVIEFLKKDKALFELYTTSFSKY